MAWDFNTHNHSTLPPLLQPTWPHEDNLIKQSIKTAVVDHHEEKDKKPLLKLPWCLIFRFRQPGAVGGGGERGVRRGRGICRGGGRSGKKTFELDRFQNIPQESRDLYFLVSLPFPLPPFWLSVAASCCHLVFSSLSRFLLLRMTFSLEPTSLPLVAIKFSLSCLVASEVATEFSLAFLVSLVLIKQAQNRAHFKLGRSKNFYTHSN